MKLGPEFLTKKLEKVRSALSSLVGTSVEFINTHRERIEVFHRSAVIHVFSCGFPVVFCVNSEGQTIAGVVLSDPFTKAPSAYRMKLDSSKILEDFEKTFGESPSSFRSGIFDFPPKTRFIAVDGQDEWLEKELLLEEVKGKKLLSFAKEVDKKSYRKLEQLNGGKISEMTYSKVDDEGVHLAVLMPEGFNPSHAPLLSEMAKIIREKMNLSPSKLSKLPSLPGRAIALFTIPLDELPKKNPQRIAEVFESRLKEGYRGFLKGADVV